MNTEKKIIIVGAGGFGREVVWTIQDCNKISRTYSIDTTDIVVREIPIDEAGRMYEIGRAHV